MLLAIVIAMAATYAICEVLDITNILITVPIGMAVGWIVGTEFGKRA
jgi:hypothetical protein